MRRAERMRTLFAGDLRLEPQLAAHAEAMFVVLSDPAIYEFENEPPGSVDPLRVRFAELESRASPTGQEQWLNWVVRLPTGELAGYVQATVYPNHRAGVAYEFASAFWGQGYARRSLEAMFEELAQRYEVALLSAVLKQQNFRSLALLRRLGFTMMSPEEHARREVERDEHLMARPAKFPP
jgi:[ribosomal protein S5]-alanine N-acetyltransferase